MAWTPNVHSHARPTDEDSDDVADAEEAIRARRQQVARIGQCPRTCDRSPPRSLRCLSRDTPATATPWALQRALNGPFTGASPSPRGLGPQRVKTWSVCPSDGPATERVAGPTAQSESCMHAATTPSLALPKYPEPVTAQAQTAAHSVGQISTSTGGSAILSAEAWLGWVPSAGWTDEPEAEDHLSAGQLGPIPLMYSTPPSVPPP